ncbi:hypothetical protein [Lysobacter fragariae]
MIRLLSCCALLVLAGCSAPKPPEKEQPVDPQAAAVTQAIKAPMDKARGVEDQMQEAADKQQKEIDAATGQ